MYNFALSVGKSFIWTKVWKIEFVEEQGMLMS